MPAGFLAAGVYACAARQRCLLRGLAVDPPGLDYAPSVNSLVYMASKMIQLREDVYRRLKKRKGSRSFSVVVEELLENDTTTDSLEILRRLERYKGATGYSASRASARHKRAG